MNQYAVRNKWHSNERISFNQRTSIALVDESKILIVPKLA